MRMYVHVSVQICAHVCIGQKITLGAIFQVLLTLFFETVSLKQCFSFFWGSLIRLNCLTNRSRLLWPWAAHIRTSTQTYTCILFLFFFFCPKLFWYWRYAIPIPQISPCFLKTRGWLNCLKQEVNIHKYISPNWSGFMISWIIPQTSNIAKVIRSCRSCMLIVSRPGKSVILLFHMGTCSVLSTDCHVVPEARHGYLAMPRVAVMWGGLAWVCQHITSDSVRSISSSIVVCGPYSAFSSFPKIPLYSLKSQVMCYIQLPSHLKSTLICNNLLVILCLLYH